MQFKRNVSTALLDWKNAKKRKPLILQGARQTGKTFLLKKFGDECFEDTAYFNFEEQPDLKQFFENTKDANRILQNLSLVYGKEIKPGSTLIIFDEIQECNQALNTLKYFQENAPDYFIAAAGSLLGISLGKERSFPVGKVEFLQVYPLSFTEFLGGAAPDLNNYLNQLRSIQRIPDIFYKDFLEKFRMYFISGGMPEAAATLLEGSSIEDTQKVLTDILTAYRLDFSKHAPAKDIVRIGYVWDSIPGQLARENKKFLYQAIKSGARAREYEEALLWLIQAGLVQKIYRCNKPNLPLSAYDDLSAFKLYMLDVGLLRSMAQLEPGIFMEGNRLFTEFKGSLTENYVLQSLMTQLTVVPRYWTSEGKAELDFLIQYKDKIIPCEVKADENTKSKSLTVYMQKYAPACRIKYSLKNLSFHEGLLNIPLFLSDYTIRLIDMT